MSLLDKIWGRDWFISLMVGVILLVIAQFGGLNPLDRIIYDFNLRHISQVSPPESIAVIAIDDPSLAQLGEWPWSRAIYARLVDLLAPYGQVMATTLDFSYPQTDPGQLYFKELMTSYHHSNTLHQLTTNLKQLEGLIQELYETRPRYSRSQSKINQLHQFYQDSKLAVALPELLTTLEEKINAAEVELDSDRKLAYYFKQTNKMILGVPFQAVKKSVSTPLPKTMLLHQLNVTNDRFDHWRELPQPPHLTMAQWPLPLFVDSVAGMGALTLSEDVRHFPLVVRHQDHYFPTLPLLLAAKSQNLSLDAIKVGLGKGIRVGSLRLNTDSQLAIRPMFYTPTQGKLPFSVDSLSEVLSGQIAAEKYRNKIILIGLTTPRYSVVHATPLGEMPSVLVIAHHLTSLLNEDFLTTPNAAHWIEFTAFIGVIAYLIFILPRLTQKIATMINLSLLALLELLYFSFMSQQFFISLTLPIALIIVGPMALAIQHGLMAYQDAFRAHPEAVESNRLLGLAFQGQGYLDLAFDKFRLCPPEDTILGMLYNLALDYELKRQFRGARSVYRYISRYNSSFRDVERRLLRLSSLQTTQLRNGSRHPFNEWLQEERDEKPSLGRYQIEKVLGKGAMGIVYLGKDPKLDRLVAIKTLPLSQEFEAEELHEATTRFFREAAAAGRLTHQNIVSIYDAGEEQDLAYISMEFFKGGNLIPYTRSDNLLPIETVMEIVSQLAKALHYAHQQGVIHRDIKPANIMYNPANGEIKMTDFGIARITDSNKTKTGIILGTPSYMSPEQLAGKKLDGRTDLFSLGVMLYQLLTGVLPFQADSMATLMFKIANEPHQNIGELRPQLPPCLKKIVDKSLQKNVKERFQNGAQFAQALYDCLYSDEFTAHRHTAKIGCF